MVQLVGYDNPDKTEWELDSRESIFNKFYWLGPIFHSEGYYELRTKKPFKYDKSGNQCVYDKKGLLITDIPTAGSADKVSPNYNVTAHVEADVSPYNWAKELGKKYVDMYYEVRPIW